MLQPIRNSFSRNFQNQNTEITNKAPFTIYQSSNFTQTNKRNLKSKSIDFLKRNIKIKKKTESLKMMNQLELNNLLYKLKNYYDEIEIENNRRIREVNEIRIQNKIIENKIMNVEKGKEIESETDKISGLDKVVNVNEIINNIQLLDLKSKNGKKEVINEEEYTSTLKYLIEDSKNQLIKINEETFITEQKIHELNLVNINLDNNISKRNDNYFKIKQMNNIIEKQLGKINNVMIEQEIKKSEMERINLNKEKNLNELKERYNKDKELGSIKFNQYKEEQLEKINIYKYQKEKKSQKENETLNFIIGIYYFQKYFINNQKKNNSEEEIINNEYKLDSDFINFMKGQQYIFSDLDEELISEDNQKTERNRIKNDIINKSNKINKIKSSSIGDLTNRTKTKIKILKPKLINIDEIRSKFNYINLKYNEVYDFYSKIISLANFRRKKMTDLNKNLINLQTKKNLYIKKVQNIINKDFKNLNDLIEKNSKFKKFYEDNKNEIHKAIKKREEIISKTIKEINADFSHPDLNLIKKRNLFLEKCRIIKRKINVIYESLIESMIILNNFKYYDENKMSLKLNKQNYNSSERIIELTTNFIKQYSEMKLEKYIKDILEYAKKKNIQYSEIIYNILFKNIKSEENLKIFINENLIDDTLMFYFFKLYHNQIEFSKLIKCISTFYTNIFNDKNNFDRSGNLKRSTVKKLTKFNDSKIIKKKKSQIIITQKKEELIQKQYYSDSIFDEYNYEKTTDDSEDYNKIKILRPKTSRIPISKKIVKQLYEPSLKKSQYLRQLKSCYTIINSDSNLRRSNSRVLKRKWSELGNIENQFYIYNNKSKIFFLYNFRY